MTRIFLLFLSLSLSGSLVIICLLLLKPFIKQRLSRTWQYYILLIVIFRLLLPFGFETNLAKLMFSQAEDYVITINSSNYYEKNALYSKPSPDNPSSENNSAVPIGQSNPVIHLFFSWGWLLWMIPATTLLLRKFISYHHFVSTVKNESKKITNPTALAIYNAALKQMHMKHAPELFYNNRIGSPMLVGILRPVIILPDIDNDTREQDLSFVLQHELTHYKRLDIVYKWLAQITVCLHWFNPFAHWLGREIERNCELSCDEYVIQRLNKEDRMAYGDMLLNSIQSSQPHHLPSISVTLSKDAKLAKERLGAIMKFKKKSKRILFISVILTAIIFCGSAYAGGYYGTNIPSSPIESTDIQTELSETNNIQSIDQCFIFEQVEMRQYEGDDGHPYIHEISQNCSDQAVIGYQHGMLAYDENGNPLEIDWWSLDTDYKPSYYYLFSTESAYLDSDQINDEYGGFSLNFMGIDPEAENISYVLYCMKEITFENGTIWSNPNYDEWLDTYQGKTVSVDILENYYPYVQSLQ